MADYIAACLRAAGTNYSVSGAIGATLVSRKWEGATVGARPPHRLLTLAAATVVVDGDVRFGRPPLARAVYEAVAAAVGARSQTPSTPLAIIPIATVEHDNKYLVYGKGTCASGAACVGASLDGAPGPLDRYVLPCGEETVTGYCLLCTRTDAAAINVVYNEVGRLHPKGGQSPMIVPPFQNPVNTPGGYKSECCGVTPSSSIFSPVHVVGSNFDMRVVTIPGGKLAVDQDAAVWAPDNHFLGHGPGRLPASASLLGQPRPAGVFQRAFAGAALSKPGRSRLQPAPPSL